MTRASGAAFATGTATEGSTHDSTEHANARFRRDPWRTLPTADLTCGVSGEDRAASGWRQTPWLG